MIQTAHLFPALNTKLIGLLRSLTPEEWLAPTLARQWSVKDVASHLLDGNLRMISIYRDKHFVPPEEKIESYNDLVSFLNQLNADWVKATKRISPALLTDLLAFTGDEYNRLIAAQDMDADAVFAVSWAGETVSKNWFHIAREFTEKWHHQQQIREATGKEGIMTKEFFYPVMDTFLRGLPYTYKNVTMPDGTSIKITVETEIGGEWFLTFHKNKWEISKDEPAHIHTSLNLLPDITWKLFTKGLSPEIAEKNSVIRGDISLAKNVFKLIAVMA